MRMSRIKDGSPDGLSENQTLLLMNDTMSGNFHANVSPRRESRKPMGEQSFSVPVLRLEFMSIRPQSVDYTNRVKRGSSSEAGVSKMVSKEGGRNTLSRYNNPSGQRGLFKLIPTKVALVSNQARAISHSVKKTKATRPSKSEVPELIQTGHTPQIPTPSSHPTLPAKSIKLTVQSKPGESVKSTKSSGAGKSVQPTLASKSRDPEKQSEPQKPREATKTHKPGESMEVPESSTAGEESKESSKKVEHAGPTVPSKLIKSIEQSEPKQSTESIIPTEFRKFSKLNDPADLTNLRGSVEEIHSSRFNKSTESSRAIELIDLIQSNPLRKSMGPIQSSRFQEFMEPTEPSKLPRFTEQVNSSKHSRSVNLVKLRKLETLTELPKLRTQRKPMKFSRFKNSRTSLEPMKSGKNRKPVELRTFLESVDPTESITFSEFVEPTESSKVMEFVEPTEPSKVMEFVEPPESNKSAEFVRPNWSNKSVKFVEPTESTKLKVYTESIDSRKPTESTNLRKVEKSNAQIKLGTFGHFMVPKKSNIPVKLVELTESSKFIETIKQIESSKIGEPIESAESTKSMESVGPEVLEQVNESTRQTESSTSDELMESTDSGKPDESVESIKPSIPEKPEDISGSIMSGDQIESNQPVKSIKETEPVEPTDQNTSRNNVTESVYIFGPNISITPTPSSIISEESLTNVTEPLTVLDPNQLMEPTQPTHSFLRPILFTEVPLTRDTTQPDIRTWTSTESVTPAISLELDVAAEHQEIAESPKTPNVELLTSINLTDLPKRVSGIEAMVTDSSLEPSPGLSPDECLDANSEKNRTTDALNDTTKTTHASYCQDILTGTTGGSTSSVPSKRRKPQQNTTQELQVRESTILY
ncbi:uncharacterized protein LOC127529448 [Erpetoichthys calabaricus]|uniref:uncharacterized protein LOC127529448 n=1 Tax=Erpetoichthys calabaricus TaxID=27687 RepID=UPI002233F318|nr:uncharacterized protein LOC127529448 [Erpetoichthys calabaricus]